MRSSPHYGLALILGTLAQVATMAFHPTSLGDLASQEAVAHEMQHLLAVHALGLVSVPIVVFGLLGATLRLGWDRPTVAFAFIVYAFSAVAIMFAAIADGLVNAALIPQMVDAVEPKLQTVKAALVYNFQLNQACAKVYVFGSSLAVIFWSIALWKRKGFERIIGAFGLIAGLAALAGLLSGHVRMSAHGFGLIVALQAVWLVALGVAMIRDRRDDNAAAVAGDT